MSRYTQYLGNKKCCDLRDLGPQGPAGPTGAQGPQGIPGTFPEPTFTEDTLLPAVLWDGGNYLYSPKTFVIDHPRDNNKYLVHACLEGPEAGVYYRGKSEITNNESITINLPDYVEHLATDFTIQITPIFSNKEIKQLYVSEVENNSFIVYGENTKFFWLVQGKRCDIVVEPSKDNTIVNGTGPYKWI